MEKQRNYKIDNIKAILIFLVVFGHMLELTSGGTIYRIIYSFHMPAFIFITGYYAKFRPQKILRELIVPYVLFQTFYLLFDGYIKNEPVTFQYTQPYWLLWYLLTTIMYYMLLPLIKVDSPKQRLRIFILSVITALLAGYDDTVGNYMSLSRMLVFFPFFILGNYIGDNNVHKILFEKRHKKAALFIGVIISSYYIITARITSAMLYGSCSYKLIGYGLHIRAILCIISFIWILALFNFVPDIKIPMFSELGKGTFSVFLLHGFIQKWLGKSNFFNQSQYIKLALAFAVSAFIVLLFGNRYFSRVFNRVIRGENKKSIFHCSLPDYSGINIKE